VGLVLARLDKGIGAAIQSFFLKDGLTASGSPSGESRNSFRQKAFAAVAPLRRWASIFYKKASP
jgi:hypothetical protein